jgi:hypothetical protein
VEERDPVLAAWQAAGTDLTMLPSGMEVRLEQVPVAEMIRTGFLPGSLRQLALRFASSEGVEPDKLETEERARWAELENLMISRWVTAVRWICECPTCTRRRAKGSLEPFEERPYKLTPEQLAAEPPVMARIDLVALHDIVLFARTPLQVDALARVAHDQMTGDEAAAIVDAEQSNTLTGWASFRGQSGGLDAHAQRADLGTAAVDVPRPPRAVRRAAARRRPRRPPVAGGRETQQPTGS